MKIWWTTILLFTPLLIFPQDEGAIKADFQAVEFRYDTISGIGHEKGCTRRDPSDVIKSG